MLSWWYGRGWLWAMHQIGARLNHIGSVFAVRVLLRTWFAPWKQITSPSSFNNFFQAAADNLVSRVIGSWVRGTMLVLASLWAGWVIITGIALIILWPLVPLAVVILPLLTVNEVGL